MTVDDYIDSLPEDRRIAIRAVREAVNSKLPAGYEEGIVYDMISWFVPFTRLAETYNGQPLCVASLGAQKNHMALYMMSVYGDDKLKAWFEKAYKASGKKLDMGKSCVRFKKVEDLALDVIGDAIAKVPVDAYVAHYEAVRANTADGKKGAGKAKAALAKAKDLVGRAKAALGKARDAMVGAEGKAKQSAGKAKAALANAEGKAKQTAGKAKAALANAEGKAKQTAGKAKAALAKAEGKAKQTAGKAKAAIVKAEGKAKAAVAKAKKTAKRS